MHWLGCVDVLSCGYEPEPEPEPGPDESLPSNDAAPLRRARNDLRRAWRTGDVGRPRRFRTDAIWWMAPKATRSGDTDAVLTELEKLVARPDPSSIYLIYPDQPTPEPGSCAWHDQRKVHGVAVQFAVSTAREVSEAVEDLDVTGGWLDRDDEETATNASRCMAQVW